MTLNQPESKLRVKEEWAKKENKMGRGLKLDRNVSCSLFQVTNEETQISTRPMASHSCEETFQEHCTMQVRNTFLKSTDTHYGKTSGCNRRKGAGRRRRGEQTHSVSPPGLKGGSED